MHFAGARCRACAPRSKRQPAAGPGRAAPATQALLSARAGVSARLDPSGSLPRGRDAPPPREHAHQTFADARGSDRGKRKRLSDRDETKHTNGRIDHGRASRCPPRLRGVCASHFLPARQKSLKPSEPQVNSLSVFERRRKVATAFRTVLYRSLLDVVAQFGQHNGGLVRRNSLLCDPGCPGHIGQRG